MTQFDPVTPKSRRSTRRESPMWIFRLTQILAACTLVGTSYLALHWSLVAESEHPWAYAVGIGVTATFLTGWLYGEVLGFFFNAWADSVENESRADFGTMLFTLGILVFTALTFAIQKNWV